MKRLLYASSFCMATLLPLESEIAVTVFHKREALCAGARYHQHVVISAASCISENPENYIAVLMKANKPEFSGVHEIILHPFYHARPFAFNLAILKVYNFLSPDPGSLLPKIGSLDMASKNVFLLGWDQAKLDLSSNLKKVTMEIVQLIECNDQRLELVYPPVVFCAKPKHALPPNFKALPGSPVFKYRGDDNVLIGIKSTDKSNSSVFTEILPSVDWIQQNSSFYD